MSAKHLELHVSPNAKPVSCHKPASIPIHCQEKVPRDLERDVEIGVLENVDPNTSVKWCSPMVVTAKGDGSSRKTVNLKLNKKSGRKTHHLPRTFHRSDRVPKNTKNKGPYAVSRHLPSDEQTEEITEDDATVVDASVTSLFITSSVTW